MKIKTVLTAGNYSQKLLKIHVLIGDLIFIVAAPYLVR